MGRGEQFCKELGEGLHAHGTGYLEAKEKLCNPVVFTEKIADKDFQKIESPIFI